MNDKKFYFWPSPHSDFELNSKRVESNMKKIRYVKNIAIIIQVLVVFLFVVFHLLDLLLYWFNKFNNMTSYEHELYFFWIDVTILINQAIILDSILYTSIGLQILDVFLIIYLFRGVNYVEV